MAKRITEVLIDDLDGSEIEAGRGGTVVFSLEGNTYEIDLGSANIAALREALAPFVKAARKRSAAKSGRATQANSSSDLKAAREWLRAQGHQVSDRGRIPAELMAMYRDAA